MCTDHQFWIDPVQLLICCLIGPEYQGISYALDGIKSNTSGINWAELVLNTLTGGIWEGHLLRNEDVNFSPHFLYHISSDPSNYRPVLNLLFQGNVVERVVTEQLQAFLVETSVLDPFQSGFCLSHGMEMGLVTLTDDLCRHLDQGRSALLLQLNLTTA